MQTIFVKQYGLPKSGTNIARYILLKHSNVIALKHVLGDSHQSPAGEVLKVPQTETPIDAVIKCTLKKPSVPTNISNPAQRLYIARIAEALYESMRSGSLFFCISTKHPYPWIHDMLEEIGLLTLTDDQVPDREEAVTALCHVYNMKMASWLRLLERQTHRVIVVRHEDLALCPSNAVERIGKAISRRASDPWIPKETTISRSWDNSPVSFSRRPFDRRHHVDGLYMDDLCPNTVARIDALIDWSALSTLSYMPTSPLCNAMTH